jgi:hypothetical protein
MVTPVLGNVAMGFVVKRESREYDSRRSAFDISTLEWDEVLLLRQYAAAPHLPGLSDLRKNIT